MPNTQFDLTPGNQHRLQRLWIHPIKSTRAWSLAASGVDALGLEHDRRMVVVDERGHFLSQRELPRMALITARIRDDQLKLDAPNAGALRVRLEASAAVTEVSVWRRSQPGIPLPEKTHEWLSAYLERTCWLVMLPPGSANEDDPRQATGGYVDAAPILLLGTASLAFLNQKLKTAVGVNRFRPNLLVTTNEPHEEDRWRLIRVGSIRFRSTKKCSRCVVTTVDPEHGEQQGPEPLNTLASYRKQGSNVVFGVYLRPLDFGRIHTGDKVEVLDREQ